MSSRMLVRLISAEPRQEFLIVVFICISMVISDVEHKHLWRLMRRTFLLPLKSVSQARPRCLEMSSPGRASWVSHSVDSRT